VERAAKRVQARALDRLVKKHVSEIAFSATESRRGPSLDMAMAAVVPALRWEATIEVPQEYYAARKMVSLLRPRRVRWWNGCEIRPRVGRRGPPSTGWSRSEGAPGAGAGATGGAGGSGQTVEPTAPGYRGEGRTGIDVSCTRLQAPLDWLPLVLREVG
jgi:hypothetical protein